MSCRHHIYLEVNTAKQSIIVSHRGFAPDELPTGETCSLDVAERDGMSVEEVAKLLGRTNDRIKQIETSALRKLRLSASSASGYGMAIDDRVVEWLRGVGRKV